LEGKPVHIAEELYDKRNHKGTSGALANCIRIYRYGFNTQLAKDACAKQADAKSKTCLICEKRLEKGKAMLCSK